MALYEGTRISGRVGDRVYARDGRVWLYRPGKDRKTEGQRRHRALFAEASGLWSELSQTERELWRLSAVYELREGLQAERKKPFVSGCHLFVSAAVRALRAGWPVPRTPDQRPPRHEDQR